MKWTHPILFLDIDGVLNCSNGVQSRILEEKIQLLNLIYAKTFCKVVISSTWRLHSSLTVLQEEFKARGYNGPIVDITPTLRLTDPELHIPRGLEIHAYISKHSIGRHSYAILDDCNDMLLYQGPNFFQTDHNTGLTKEIADRVVAFLNGEIW